MAVDVGCGQGQIMSKLVDHFYHIVGVDKCIEQIRKAEEMNSYHNVKFQ